MTTRLWRNTRRTTGYNIACREGLDVERVKRLIEFEGVDPTARGVQGRQALHYASLSGNLEILTELLLHPAVDIHARDNTGRTPSHFSSVSNAATAKKLLEAGAQVNTRDNE